MQNGVTQKQVQKSMEFDEREVKYEFLETSTFDIMFPRHREKYVRDAEEYIRKVLKQHKLQLALDYNELVLSVSTTKQTRDPYAIISGRDMLKLVSRGVPLDKAMKVFESGITCDIIQINIMTRNKTTFLKRRERLLGPYGNTLKSLEILTKCYILPYGNTVAAIGHHQNLKEVRRVVVRCMENVHPIYEIKRLMVKRELEKDPNLKTENWERYLPQYKKTHQKKRKLLPTKKEKTVNDLVPQQESRKVDKDIESGAYFTKAARKERKDLKNNKTGKDAKSKDKIDNE